MSTFFGGYPFEVQATFMPASTHQPYQTCRKGVLSVLQHASKFQAKILSPALCQKSNIIIFQLHL